MPCFTTSCCSLEIYTTEISHKSGPWFVYSFESSFSSNYSSSLLSKDLLSIDSVAHSKPQTQWIKWKIQQINEQLPNFKSYNVLNILIKSMSHSGYEQFLCRAYPHYICNSPIISRCLGYQANCHSRMLLIVILLWLNNGPKSQWCCQLGRRKTNRKVLYLSENMNYSRDILRNSEQIHIIYSILLQLFSQIFSC